MRSRLTGVRNLVGKVGGLGAAPRREDEREGAVVADLVDRPRASAAKSSSVSPGKPTMMSVVSAQSGTCSRIWRDPVEVALAVVGAAHRLQDRGSSPTGAAGGCARTARQARRGRGSRPRACPSGAGSCSGCARSRRPRRPARSSSAKRIRSLRRQVAPVAVHVLAQQGHLAHAVGGQALDLGDQLARRDGSPRGLAWRARCSTSRRSCSPARSAARPETRARACAGRCPEKSSNSK